MLKDEGATRARRRAEERWSACIILYVVLYRLHTYGRGHTGFLLACLSTRQGRSSRGKREAFGVTSGSMSVSGEVISIKGHPYNNNYQENTVEKTCEGIRYPTFEVEDKEQELT